MGPDHLLQASEIQAQHLNHWALPHRICGILCSFLFPPLSSLLLTQQFSVVALEPRLNLVLTMASGACAPC